MLNLVPRKTFKKCSRHLTLPFWRIRIKYPHNHLSSFLKFSVGSDCCWSLSRTFGLRMSSLFPTARNNPKYHRHCNKYGAALQADSKFPVLLYFVGIEYFELLF